MALWFKQDNQETNTFSDFNGEYKMIHKILERLDVPLYDTELERLHYTGKG